MTSGTGLGRRFLAIPTVESLVVGAFALFGFRNGLSGISDNSAFVHIRTGIEMVRHHGAIPRTDPYSFTAHGHPWVVQSWLASAVYGAAYEWVGAHFLVFVNGVLAAVLAGVVAHLARTGTAMRTMATAVVAVFAGAVYWAPRPLMFGLLAMALLILVVERRHSPWWLVPIGWVWVNTHGSFPLGAAWLAARAVGEAVDLKGRPRWVERYLACFVGSIALGAVNPLGPRLLAFPFAVRDKESVFRNVVEWRSPDFQTGQGLILLLFLSLAFLILLRARLRWGDILPVIGFVALGLISVRNMSAAAIVLAPALAHAMATTAPQRTDGSPTAEAGAGRVNMAIVGVLLAAAVIFTLSEQSSNVFDFKTYPTLAEDYMQRNGLLDPTQHRVAVQDIVGCYLILLRGTSGRVFIDDRVDMYPVGVSNDYDMLLHGAPASLSVLDRYRIDTVLWDRSLALVDLLHAAGGWRQVFPDQSVPSSRSAGKWVVLVRDPSVRGTRAG